MNSFRSGSEGASICRFLIFLLSILHSAQLDSDGKPIDQRIADHAKAMKVGQDVVRLVVVGNGGIEVMDVAALTVYLKPDCPSLISDFVEIAVILEPKNKFFDRGAGTLRS